MIINNWFVLCDGYVAVTDTWARTFFVAFYITGPLVLLNIAVAAVMDAFLIISHDLAADRPPDACAADGAAAPATTLAVNHRLDADRFRAHLEGASAVIDASSVSGTSTGVSGVYRAYVSSDVARSRHRDVLRNWLLDDEGRGRVEGGGA